MFAHADFHGDGEGGHAPDGPAFLEVATVRGNEYRQDGGAGLLGDKGETGAEGVDGAVFIAGAGAFGEEEEAATGFEAPGGGAYHVEAGGIGDEAGEAGAGAEEGIGGEFLFHDAADPGDAADDEDRVPEGGVIGGDDEGAGGGGVLFQIIVEDADDPDPDEEVHEPEEAERNGFLTEPFMCFLPHEGSGNDAENENHENPCGPVGDHEKYCDGEANRTFPLGR